MNDLLRLTDFYQPLNFQILSISVLLLVLFDALGTLTKRLLLKPSQPDPNRVLNWLIGLGLFTFVWFILRLFIPPRFTSVLISVIIFATISIPYYIRRGELAKLIACLWRLKTPLLIIAPFLPAVFVKASLPPYYADEMAYWFIPPYFTKLIDVWRFDGGLYSNVPMLFSSFFNLIFVLTKTYAITRLFHFLILITSLVYSYQKLKDHFGWPAAFFFVFTFMSLPIDIVLIATLGYVDIATISFALIAIVGLADFSFTKARQSLFISAISWGMAVGSKYTAATVFSTYLLATVVVNFIKQKPLFRQFTTPILIKTLFLVVLFGGYWYVKNLLAYGNPVYPFLFPCLRYAEYCQTQAANFFAWTTPITLINLPGIVKELLPANLLLQIALFVAPALALFNKNPKTRLFSAVLALTIVLEFLLLKRFSGFYARYQQHLQLLMLLLITIQVANHYSTTWVGFVAKAFYLVVFYFVLSSYVLTIKNTNSLKFLNWTEINYARGKIDVYGWVDQKFPRVKAGIAWCENPPTSQPIALARYDPDMIWYEYDGFMRSFMTNCYFENPPLDDLPIDQVLSTAKAKKLDFWTISPNRCLPQADVKKHLDYEDDHQLYLRQLNNIIICHAKEVGPNLYHFNYAAL